MPPTETITPEQTQASLEKAEQERNDALEAVKKAEAERDALAAQVDELRKAAAKMPAEDGEPDEDDLNKADLPPKVRARLVKAEEQAAEMRARVEKAEEVAKGERDARLTREFIAKAETMPALPGTADDLGPVLKTISDSVPAETFSALEDVLKGANEQIRSGSLFAEQGSGAETRRSGAYDEVLAKASEIRKSDGQLTQTQAIDRVLGEDRALQERYLAEVR